MLNCVWPLPAKSSTDGKSEWLPLVTHLLDTAFVMRKLTEDWLPQCVPEAFEFSVEEFHRVTNFLALTHDLGKCTPAFAVKLLPKMEEIRDALETASLDVPPGMLNESQVPHGHAGAALLRKHHFPKSIAAVVGAHHGRPEGIAQEGDDDIIDCPRCYFGSKGSRWEEAQNELITWALETSGYASAEELPELSRQAQIVLTGLVIMADWIASNTKYFPLIPTDCIPRAYTPQRAEQALKLLDLPAPWKINEDWKEEDFFRTRFGFIPNVVQRKTIETATKISQPGCLILEAPMGIGKTEAALAAAEIWMNRFQLGGMEFFLPSQATGNAMFSRLLTWTNNVPHAASISVELAHAMAEMNDEFAALQQGNVIIEQDGKEHITVHSFFRGRKTRLLAELVVGTVDQLLMAGLKQKHVMLRHLGLIGKVIIVDEVHAYDAYMNRYLDCVLAWSGAYRVPVILLSATLPEKRRQELIEAYQNKRRRGRERNLAEHEKEESYPLITWTDGKQTHQKPIVLEGEDKTITVERMEEETMQKAVIQALCEGACVGIIVNTVRRAQCMMQVFLQALPNVTVLLDHSQFIAPDRIACEKEIAKRAGKHSESDDRRSVLVIGTQVLEQSLDVDFDLLVTDLCPMDLLMQRTGRLHRHTRVRPESFRDAKLIVLHADGTLEEGAKAIYWEYLLNRTGELLPDRFRIPGEISTLVQETYNEENWTQEAREEHERTEAVKKQKADCYRLDRPGSVMDDTIAGLLDDVPEMSEIQTKAAVRDGEMSIEVLVLGMTEEGAALLFGDNKGEVFSMTDTPCMEDARKIACQRMRLPRRFAKTYLVDRVLRYLEEQTEMLVPEWKNAPMLEGELFLFLDRKGDGELPGYKLHYDAQIGLTYEEEKNGSD